MAQALSVGDTMVVTIVTKASDFALNRLAYEITAIVSGTPTDQDFVTAFDTAIATAWRAILGTNAIYEGVMGTLHGFAPVRIYRKVEDTTGTGNGTFGSMMTSAQTAGLIRWLTPFAGPKYRGRLYAPGVPLSAVAADERPTVAYLTALDAAALAILNFTSASNAGRTASCRLSLRSKVGTLTAVTDVVTPRAWATQKRRGDYGRPNSNPL
jgi:hypothetical protein